MKTAVIRRSRHTGENWHDQWKRVERWLGRLLALESKHLIGGGVDMTYVVLPEYAVEEIDVAYAFMMNCFHLKDWIVRSTSVPASEVEDCVRHSMALSACADICHGVKHFALDRARSDAKWSRARGWFQGKVVPMPFVLVANQALHLTALAQQCVDDWRSFLEAHDLLVAGAR